MQINSGTIYILIKNKDNNYGRGWFVSSYSYTKDLYNLSPVLNQTNVEFLSFTGKQSYLTKLVELIENV